MKYFKEERIDAGLARGKRKAVGLFLGCLGMAGIGGTAAAAAGAPPTAPPGPEWVQACGECVVSGDRTLEHTRACAYQAAVEEAMRAAGVAKNVVSSTVLTSTQQGDDYARQQFFDVSEVTYAGGLSGMRGELVMNQVDARGDVVVTYCAEFQVQGYSTQPDPGFKHRVEGLQTVYASPGELQFRVQGPGGCLQAFLVEGTRAHRFFPSPAEPVACFSAFTGTTFPLPAHQHRYELFAPEEEALSQLLFVFTREDWTQSVAPELGAQDLLHWIQSIEPRDRDVHRHPFDYLR
jgi:hypothetical protein